MHKFLLKHKNLQALLKHVASTIDHSDTKTNVQLPEEIETRIYQTYFKQDVVICEQLIPEIVESWQFTS